MSGIITFVKRIGFRVAKVFRAKPREVVEYIAPHVPIDLQAAKRARKAQQAKAALSRLKSAKRAAASAVRHEAHARLALKRYNRKIAEKREYGLGLTYTARMKRRHLTRAKFAAIEKASLKKRTLQKRDRDYKSFLKKKAWRKAEFEKRWAKTAAKITKDIREREELSREYQKFIRTTKRKKYGQGWYLIYEIELCEKSPPCEPDSPNNWWELRTKLISQHAKKHGISPGLLDREMKKVYDRAGCLIRTRRERIIYVKGGEGI